MSDIFSSYLEKDREIQNSLSTPRLILAAVVQAPNAQQRAMDLRNLMQLSEPEFQQALQRLADEGLVRAVPGKDGLMVMATAKGRQLAAS
jgi:Mn-dependent DtxR family transcriptional regulator